MEFFSKTPGGNSGMRRPHPLCLFWSEADGAWAADVPDLQSCSAFGAIPAEALADVEKAMAAWLDVAREDHLPLPEPRYRGARQAAG